MEINCEVWIKLDLHNNNKLLWKVQRKTLSWLFLVFSTHQIKCSCFCLREYFAGVVHLLHPGKMKRSLSWYVVRGKYKTRVQPITKCHSVTLSTLFDIAGNVQVVANTFETGLQFPQNGADCPTFNCWSTAILCCGLADEIAPIHPCFHGIWLLLWRSVMWLCRWNI